MEPSTALITNTEVGIKPNPKPAKKTFSKKMLDLAVDIIAPVIWLYVLIKLFVYDIDILIANSISAKVVYLLNFKLPVLLILLAILWTVLGTKKFLKIFFYVLFYPLLLIFVLIPWFIFKQRSWTLAFAVINSTISFFKSLKYSFTTFTLFLAACICIVFFSNSYIIYISTGFLLILLLLTYIRKFWFAFKPSELFGIQVKIFKKIRKLGYGSYSLEEDIKSLPMTSLSSQQLQKWTEKLQMAVLFNRCCLFVSKKLEQFRDSPWQITSPIFSVLFMFIFTVITFAFINLGLFKINGNFYQYSTNPDFFTFFYYSFNRIFFSGISELSAIMPISQAVLMMQEFCSLLLTGIMFTLYVSYKSERNSKDLSEVVSEIEKEGESMEQFISDEYKINSIGDALVELQKLKANLVGFLYKITDYL